MTCPSITLGPPGTGKTTSLLRRMEEELSSGVDARRIIFLSFTRAAIAEASSRVFSKFNLNESKMPYIRTFHSLGFRLLGFSTEDNAVKKKHMREFCEMLNIPFEAYEQTDEGIFCGAEKGDRMFHLENMSRVCQEDLETIWRSDVDQDHKISLPEIERFRDAWVKYKVSRGLLDYTDTLIQWHREGIVPPVDVLFVDEAQDLSRIQWDIVRMISDKAARAYVAGDDDQAIYRWNGADVESFINLEGKRHVLSKSYRLPKQIHALSKRIVQKISNRIPKDFEPADHEGSIYTYNSVDGRIPLDQGNWLMLARNNYLLKQFVELCRVKGYPWAQTKGKSICQGGIPQAIFAWETLRAGRQVALDLVKPIYSRCISTGTIKRGYKKRMQEADKSLKVTMSQLHEEYGLQTEAPWFEAFDRLSYHDIEFFRKMLKNKESMTNKPRITISTFHSIKGAEADNVLLCTDMAARSFREYLRSTDDELRVLYVAVTRAKQNLHILLPSTANCYHLEKF